MSNTHEYVIFDRARLDPALAMGWTEIEKTHPGWSQWTSAKDFLVEWALDSSHIASVDTILAQKTVRQTLALSDDSFAFLRAFLDEKNLSECAVDVDPGDYDYGDEVVSCAGAAFTRGDLTLATLSAVCRLHASRVDPDEVLLPDVVSKLKRKPASPAMLPGLSDLMPAFADGIGVSQTRKVIDFFLRAWRERWPLQAEGQTRRGGGSIHSCTVAERLARALRKHHFSRPCIFRWYEC